MSWVDPRVDPKMSRSPVKKWAKWLNKQRIGLNLGPAPFLLMVLIPEPQSMTDAATDSDIGAPEKAPQIALGTVLWDLVWWVTECVPHVVAALLPPLLFSMTKILTWKTALTSFTDPIIWIFMALSRAPYPAQCPPRLRRWPSCTARAPSGSGACSRWASSPTSCGSAR